MVIYTLIQSKDVNKNKYRKQKCGCKSESEVSEISIFIVSTFDICFIVVVDQSKTTNGNFIAFDDYIVRHDVCNMNNNRNERNKNCGDEKKEGETQLLQQKKNERVGKRENSNIQSCMNCFSHQYF